MNIYEIINSLKNYQDYYNLDKVKIEISGNKYHFIGYEREAKTKEIKGDYESD